MTDEFHNLDQENGDHDIIDGEVVAEYSETRINLPEVDDDGVDMVYEPDIEDPGRRSFLSRVLVGGVAALALGGGAALLVEQRRRRQEPEVIVLPNGSEVDRTDVSSLYQRITELEYELTAMTAERDQLISDLSRAEALQTDIGGDLSEIQRQLEEYRTLIDLYERLEALGFDGLVQAAINVVIGALSSLMGIVSLLQSGLNTGQSVIDSFVALLPGPRDGVRWLQRQVTALADSLDWLAEQVQEAIDPVEPFTELIAEFVLWVLSRLPFGIGTRAEAGMEAMRTVINDLPNLITGINDDVLDPLAEWFGANDENNLTGILIEPVRENILEPARDTMAGIFDFENTFQEELVTPLEEALEERQAIRDQIEVARSRLDLIA